MNGPESISFGETICRQTFSIRLLILYSKFFIGKFGFSEKMNIFENNLQKIKNLKL
jgi:hypothetical protein